MVTAGSFREDLLARLDLWTYRLPSLQERIEDFEPNLDFEIDKVRESNGTMIRFSKEARDRYLAFAKNDAEWRANFRDLNSSVTRMATLSDGGRISLEIVEQEIQLLNQRWQREENRDSDTLNEYLSDEEITELDLFDQLQLNNVIKVCRESRSMADAGRRLFAVSRESKSSKNDSHRVSQYLAKFGLSFTEL
ncbi:MAG: hypothetical protein KTR30_34805 [Saprospiraceae bacterium]|nr:hypothetical protein [Saprospiraceae bacterium]